jgi:hypothetical protein
MIRKIFWIPAAIPFLGWLAFLPSAYSQDRPAADPFVAVVARVTPPVLLQRAGADALVPLKQDDRLYPGDRVVSEEGGHASIIFADNAVELKLIPNTELTIQGQRGSNGIVKRMYMEIGRLLTRVLEGEMEVITPTCVASVKGTQWWTTVDRAQVTQVIVLEGEVTVENRSSGAINLVSAGNTATSSPTGGQTVAPTQAQEIPQAPPGSDQGSLQIEFESNSGQSKTLYIDFDR